MVPSVAKSGLHKAIIAGSADDGNATSAKEIKSMGTMRRPPKAENLAQANDQRAGATVPLLLTAKQAAAMCSKSLRTWRTWDSAGIIPSPVRIGRSTLWSVEELKAWVTAGCPRRDEWEARR